MTSVLTQRLSLRSNLGLKLANAFGVKIVINVCCNWMLLID
jgi:hypothetical protein